MKRNKKKIKIKLLKKETFLKMLLNSCGSSIWKNNYAIIHGKKVDLVQNGNLSCAFYVSSILKLFNLINEIHLTVKSTEKDLIKNNFKRISLTKNIPQGSILIWENKREYNPYTKKIESHLHIGFYLGNKKAISMSSENGFPVIHHYLYYGKRKIIKAYYKEFK